VTDFIKTRNVQVALCLALLAAPLAAQTVAPPVEPAGGPGAAASGPDEEPTIVVTATSQRGRVVGDIAPEVQLGPQDIRAIGAGSIEELLSELAPLTSSGRGRGGDAPVVLINGKRVSGFAEIRNIPPEAIERVDIMPEEVALKYGYRADQRVVNFVLRERFRAVTGELDLGGPTGGGRTNFEAEANFLRIRNGTRLSLEAEYSRDTLLLESERNLLSATQSRPFDLVGNVTAPIVGDEIDAALSALTGRVTSVAGVPAAAASAAPPLNAFTGPANVTNIAQFRSLLPDTRKVSVGGAYAGSIGATAATITAGLESTDSEARLGLPSATLLLPATNPFSPFGTDVTVNRYAPGPLVRASDNWTGRIGTALTGRIASWSWALTANYAHAEAETRTDRGLDLLTSQAQLLAGDPALNPFGVDVLAAPLIQDRATSRSDTADGELVANGALLALPGGDLAATVKAGVQTRRLATDSLRLGVAEASDLSRTQGNFQASFDLPITSVRNDVLPAIGDLSANFNVAVDQLSDFGALTTVGYGLNWKPATGISLIASATHEQGAPSIQQLGDPVVVTPNVRVFDFIAGRTVDISRIDGGNPDLAPDSRRVVKLGATVKPFDARDLTLLVNFTDSRIDNPIASFPTATAELEAAFPERFRRTPAGQLLQIDNRPVNFERSERQQLRWGFNLSEPIQPSTVEREAAAARRAEAEARRAAGGATAAAPGGPPAAGGPRAGRPPGGFGGGGGGFGGGRGGAEGRLQLSVFHTWHLRETIVIRDGVPVLDLLDGSAIGSRGGQPRHEIELRAGVGKSGMGARLSVNWQSGTRVLTDPSGATVSPDDLFFSDLATIDLRLFADLGQRRDLVRRMPFLRGTRISLAIDNIADSRLDVRDRGGGVPIGYQRDLIDPVGRSLRLSLRKLFF
jgi:hypothetical protein